MMFTKVAKNGAKPANGLAYMFLLQFASDQLWKQSHFTLLTMKI